MSSLLLTSSSTVTSIFFGDYNDAAVTTFKLKHDFFFLTNGDKAFEVSLKDNPKK